MNSNSERFFSFKIAVINNYTDYNVLQCKDKYSYIAIHEIVDFVTSKF